MTERATIRELRHALFMCAASVQGGHSAAGKITAGILGVPFPIRMESLRTKAVIEGFDPSELWPWWKRSDGEEQKR